MDKRMSCRLEGFKCAGLKPVTTLQTQFPLADSSALGVLQVDWNRLRLPRETVNALADVGHADVCAAVAKGCYGSD
jgi:hypothetical protein